MKRFATSGLTVLLLGAVIGCNQSQMSTTGSTTSTGAAATKSEAPATTPSTTPAAKSSAAPSAPGTSAPSSDANEVTMPSGLKYSDLHVGDGEIAQVNLTASVHYTGWLTDGTKFDSSLDRGEPFSFRIGAHQVIRGWDEGVQGMRIGGKRKLVIPPDMGYGASGSPPVIPPNATLVFEVELLGLERK